MTRCPGCQRVLYNRRLKNCGFCGAPIPESLRFTPEESAVVERKMEELEEQRRQRQLAADQEEAEGRRCDGGLDLGIYIAGLLS